MVGRYWLDEVYVDMVEPGLNERIRAATTDSAIILHPDGTVPLSGFPFFEELDDTFDYRFIGIENLTARWEIFSAGVVSSGSDEYETAYGLRLTLSDGRDLFDSPTLTGADIVDGMIFTLYDGDQGQILGYKKLNAE